MILFVFEIVDNSRQKPKLPCEAIDGLKHPTLNIVLNPVVKRSIEKLLASHFVDRPYNVGASILLLSSIYLLVAV